MTYIRERERESYKDIQYNKMWKCMRVKVTKMLSINVFKQHPCYKIALRNGTVLNY